MRACLARVLSIVAAFAAGPAAARPGSPACGAALAELERREQALLALPADARGAQRPRVIEQQRRAAMACLGGPPDAPPRAGLAAAPISAAPATAPVARPLPAPSASSAVVPAPPARPPGTVGSCDALGCWASDGTRLQKIGPSLLGPGGLCTVTAGFLRCP